MNELAPGVVVFDNTLPSGKSLVEFMETESHNIPIWEPSMVFNAKGEGVIDYTNRNCEVFAAPYEYIDTIETEVTPRFVQYVLNNEFRKAFTPCYDAYLKSYGDPELEGKYEDYNVLKYGRGQRFVAHVDDGKKQLRRISLVHYINDDYEGGEIVFDFWDLVVKPKAGQTLMFPSNFMYKHEVMPVMNGVRYAVVQWVK